jgi:hypothetical protein
MLGTLPCCPVTLQLTAAKLLKMAEEPSKPMPPKKKWGFGKIGRCPCWLKLFV